MDCEASHERHEEEVEERRTAKRDALTDVGVLGQRSNGSCPGHQEGDDEEQEGDQADRYESHRLSPVTGQRPRLPQEHDAPRGVEPTAGGSRDDRRVPTVCHNREQSADRADRSESGITRRDMRLLQSARRARPGLGFRVGAHEALR